VVLEEQGWLTSLAIGTPGPERRTYIRVRYTPSQITVYTMGLLYLYRKDKKEVLGRTNRLLSFDTTRTT
jgi:hypothetical protein